MDIKATEKCMYCGQDKPVCCSERINADGTRLRPACLDCCKHVQGRDLEAWVAISTI